MTLKSMEEVNCPCGEVFEAEIIQSVSAQHQPELKEMILAGEFNIVQCPACQKFIFAEKFLLYHDAPEELLAFVYPLEMQSRIKEIQDSVLQQYAQLQQELAEEGRLRYQPFLLFGLDRLCDLIHLEERRADESAIVLSLCETLSLKFYRISNDAARRQNLPSIVPLGIDHQAALKDRVQQGLEIILETNPMLEYYAQFLKRVQDDPTWNLDPSLLITTDEIS